MADYLVIGGDGLIGQGVTALLRARGQQVWTTTRRRDGLGPQRLHLDLAAPLGEFRPERRFDTVFFCAGRNPKQCLDDPAMSRLVNVERPLDLARRFAGEGSFVVKLSSNAVFDGSVAYRKADAAHCPKSLYGEQHSALDHALASAVGAAAIVRFSKVITADLPIVAAWRRDWAAGKVVTPLSDLYFAPITFPFIVELIARAGLRRMPGVFQASATEDVSYGSFAHALAARLGVAEALVKPSSMREQGLSLEAQPRYTTLDMTETVHRLKIAAPPVADAVDYLAAAALRPQAAL
ncbi:MAG TPA: sugar nucleotide-binding protein [Alphaproteobacteria bacterium]|nr:sugar nucleotide-binding protein [Alphaproteobacteria bacterium]